MDVTKYRVRSLKRTLSSISAVEITENRQQFKNYIYLITTIMIKIEGNGKNSKRVHSLLDILLGGGKSSFNVYIIKCSIETINVVIIVGGYGRFYYQQ